MELNNTCMDIEKALKREYNKQYQINNKEKIAERGKQYRIKNKKKIQEYRKNYYLKNRDLEIAYSRKHHNLNKIEHNNKSNQWKKNNIEKVKQYRKIFYENNKIEENVLRKEWRRVNPQKIKNTLLKRNYGISIKEFKVILFNQDNKCGICKKKFTEKYPYKASVDHNHNTKEIRGLLCFKCNSALGLLNDNYKNLKRAINWIRGLKSFQKPLEKQINKKIDKKYLYNIKRKFSITKDNYLNLILNSNNRCGICEENFTEKHPYRACIDHDHKTERIRGLLCSKCNNAIGFFEDNIKIIYNAIYWIKGELI